MLSLKSPGPRGGVGLGAAIVVATLLAQVTRAPPAHAETATERRRATALLRQGADLLSSKDFAAALTHFSDAYELVSSAKIQFNIGLAQEGLDRPAEATRAYQLYLDGAATDTASRRADAEARIKKLRARVTLLQVTTDGAGATVVVDGAEAGKTPLGRPLVVSPGPHQVLVQAAGGGGAPWAHAFRGEGGGSVELHASLSDHATTPPPGTGRPETRLETRPKVRLQTAATLPTSPPPTLPEPAPTASPLPALVTSPPPAETTPAPTSGPFYARAWFWAVVGGVVIGGAVATYFLVPRGTQFMCPTDRCVGGN